MKWLTINSIKDHLRLDYDCEDGLLQLYGNSAEESVTAYLNRGKTVAQCADSLEEEYGSIPANIIQASLMLVDVGYSQRSPISPTNMSAVPYTFDVLVKPYMKL